MFTEARKVVAISMLKSSPFIQYCKLIQIFIKEQHLYFIWLRILGKQLCVLTSLVHIERGYVILLTILCYTLSWSWHQNVVTLVHFGCKGSVWSYFLRMLIVTMVCFFNSITQDMRYSYGMSWPHGAMA